MNVLDHIKEEHDGFRRKIAKVEAAKGERKKETFRELYAEIHGHHEAEEKVVFPIVREQANEKGLELVREMVEEHSLGSYQFSVLERTSVENETWDAKFSVLKEVLDHHMEEEEAELMPIARKLIAEEKLNEILDKFESVLEEDMKEMKEKLEKK